ncbi:MAG: helix-turn-helix transcriptional regulator [Burkholderiaceae bacterium]
MQDLKIYRIRQVCEITGLKASTIYKLVRLELFPKQIHLTSRSTGWPSNLIHDWVNSKLGSNT